MRHVPHTNHASDRCTWNGVTDASKVPNAYLHLRAIKHSSCSTLDANHIEGKLQENDASKFYEWTLKRIEIKCPLSSAWAKPA